MARDKFWMVLGDSARVRVDFASGAGPTATIQGLPKYQHTSKASAMAEAEQLAKANPSRDFFVLEAIGVCKKVEVAWEAITSPDANGVDSSIPF